MEDVKFILFEKIEKIKTVQWLWIAAAIVVLAAVILWAIHYRKAEGRKGVKIVATIAVCFFCALFLAQIILISVNTEGIAADAVPTDDYEVYEGDVDNVTFTKEFTSMPKNGKAYRVGERIAYKFIATNNGDTAVENITVMDYAPYKEWTIARLEPGQSVEKESGYYVGGDASAIPMTVQYVVAALAILSGVVLLVSGIIVAASKREVAPHKTDVRAMTYGAICVAMAFVLSYIKLFSAPLGGSVTLASMLPIMLYANLYGTKRGLLVGLVYGLLQFIQKPEIVHWAQVVLDYPLAFTLIGLAGLSKNLPVGTLIGGFARFVIHAVSGFLFYSEVLDGAALWYSITYNGAYMLFDTLICFVLAFPVSALVKRADIGPKKKETVKAAA
ncbi:MAG: energy-coupled thiamine transporter ThiT [Clostridia bacterium]|nr:energy-coupled thiamine transporter ThiT [Clostridia bacterium]